MAHIELVTSLLDTLLQALLTNVETLSRKNAFGISHCTSLQCIRHLCTGIDNETMKGVSQGAKKITDMVSSTDFRFLEHDISVHLRLISTQIVNRAPCQESEKLGLIISAITM